MKNAQARADSLAGILKARDAAARAAAEQQRLAEVRRADSIRQEQLRPREFVLFKSTGVDVPANGYQAAGVKVSGIGTCSLHGRVEVTSGGNRDIEVSVLSGDEFTNWKNSPQARASGLFHQPPQTVTNVSVPLPGIGTYYLVLSNRFSMLTPKTVRGEVSAVCIGEEPGSVS